MLAWAAYAVGKELTSPKDLIVKTYEKQDIDTFKIGAFVVAYAIISGLHIKFIYHKVMEKKKRDSSSSSEDLNDTYQAMEDDPTNL